MDLDYTVICVGVYCIWYVCEYANNQKEKTTENLKFISEPLQSFCILYLTIFPRRKKNNTCFGTSFGVAWIH